MDYKEFNNCLEILRKKPNWFFQRDNLAQKLNCLDRFQSEGTPQSISFLFEFLKDGDETIQRKTAEVIILLSQQLKSQNKLYESLKYIHINKSDINYYKIAFAPDIYFQILAISSMNKNGYVREQATKELAVSQNPDAIKFILLRLGDWVIAVRQAAQNSIKTFFKEQFIESFIPLLPVIDALLFIRRTDLTAIYAEIVEFIFSHELTDDFYKELNKFDEKIRLIYFRNFFKMRVTSSQVVDILSKDRNYLIRAELIKHIRHLEAGKQHALIRKFLYDRSAKVRINALYEAKNFQNDYDPVIFEMTSDKSASVRELSRYLLKSKSLHFAEIYRQRLASNIEVTGSLLGLSEVGTKADLPIFEKYIQSPAAKIKLASLGAIHRIDTLLSKTYSLQLLAYPIKHVSDKSIEILSLNCDSEVLERARTIYNTGNYEQKKAVLKLFNKVGGWNVIGDLILALTDSNENIQELAWVFLQKWRNKATSLFTSPPQAEILKANDFYSQLDKTKTKMTYFREKLWNELPFYLRG